MKTIIFVLILLVGGMTGGCQSTGAGAVGGAVGLTTLDRLAGDAGKITDRELAILAGKELELQKQRATTQSQEQKKQIETLLAKNRIAQGNLTMVQTGINLGKKAVGTDWSNPKETAPWLAAGITTILGAFYRKQKIDAVGTIRAYQKNLNDVYTSATPEDANRIALQMNQHR